MRPTSSLRNVTSKTVRCFDCKAALRKFAESGRYVAAICAGPMALAKARVLGGHEATIYDGMESELIDAEYVKKNVVVSGNIITGRGPAYASDFANELIRILKNDDVASEGRYAFRSLKH